MNFKNKLKKFFEAYYCDTETKGYYWFVTFNALVMCIISPLSLWVAHNDPSELHINLVWLSGLGFSMLFFHWVDIHKHFKDIDKYKRGNKE